MPDRLNTNSEGSQGKASRAAHSAQVEVIEVSARSWWEANLKAILSDSVTQQELVDALVRLGPSPEENAKITINRDGVVLPQTQEQLLSIQKGEGPRPDLKAETALHTVAPGTGPNPDRGVALMIDAYERVQGEIAQLQEELDEVDPHADAVARHAVSQQLQQLQAFSGRIAGSINKNESNLDLIRTEVGYDRDSKAGAGRHQLVVDQAAFIQQAEQEYATGLNRIGPILNDLKEGGIAVETGFEVIDQIQHDRNVEREQQESGLELDL